MDAKTVQRLETLGVCTARDLLYMLPRRIDDRAATRRHFLRRAGGRFYAWKESWLTCGRPSVGPRRLQLVEGVLRDDSGEIGLQWFGQAYLARALRVGDRLAVNGKVESKSGRMVMASPEYDVITPVAAAAELRPSHSGLSPHTGDDGPQPAEPHLAGHWAFIGIAFVETLPDATLRRTGLGAAGAGGFRRALSAR